MLNWENKGKNFSTISALLMTLFLCTGQEHNDFVNNVLIENVEGSCSLGSTRGNTAASRKRTWTKRYNEEAWQAGQHLPAYTKHWDLFKGNLAICLKRQAHNTYVLVSKWLPGLLVEKLFQSRLKGLPTFKPKIRTTVLNTFNGILTY